MRAWLCAEHKFPLSELLFWIWTSTLWWKSLALRKAVLLDWRSDLRLVSLRVQPVNFLFNQTRATLRFPFALLCTLVHVRVFASRRVPLAAFQEARPAAIFIHSWWATRHFFAEAANRVWMKQNYKIPQLCTSPWSVPCLLFLKGKKRLRISFMYLARTTVSAVWAFCSPVGFKVKFCCVRCQIKQISLRRRNFSGAPWICFTLSAHAEMDNLSAPLHCFEPSEQRIYGLAHILAPRAIMGRANINIAITRHWSLNEKTRNSFAVEAELLNHLIEVQRPRKRDILPW